MTAPEVFQVRDGDGWEVYVPSGSSFGKWRMVSHLGGTAVVDTLPDGAVRMVASPSLPHTEYRVASSLGSGYMIPQIFDTFDEADDFLTRHNKVLAGLPGVDSVRVEFRPPAGTWTAVAEGGDRRG